jgi:hypothetical protein
LSRAFNGLIQHSFAPLVPQELRPIYTREGVTDPERLLKVIFETGDFELGDAGMEEWHEGDKKEGAWRHSLLARREQTNVTPLRFPFKEEEDQSKVKPLQPRGALDWVLTKGASTPSKKWEGFVFGGNDQKPGSVRNDFLVEQRDREKGDGPDVSRLLTQLLAHKRSHLLGLALGRSSFNILPPHATLIGEQTAPGRAPESWFVQPMISLFHVFARRAFRPIFSFNLFLIPVTVEGSALHSRAVSSEDIPRIVKGQWSLSTAHDDPDKRFPFTVKGPLISYLDQAAGPSLEELELSRKGDELVKTLTLREFCEATLFSLATTMTGGPRAEFHRRSRKLLGDRIVTSLSASRVSHVAVIDDSADLTETETLKELAKEIATPLTCTDEGLDEYRLDKSLFDRAGYASAVLPEDRCVITVARKDAQEGLKTSLLLEAGWTAYQVIGAATATGLIRSIFREITISEQAGPARIADIEGEAMVELHETYDIEITVETYRQHNDLLRKYLRIDDEYKALSDKLQALHRETSTRSEGRSEHGLALLTWAIVVLSALILVGTLALIFKPGA